MAITLCNKEIGSVGFGLMGMTWRPTQTPDKQAFKAMKTALENGCNLWNSGEFYGTDDPNSNLKLISRYFTKYPEDADKVVLSVKGGIDVRTLSPNGSPDKVQESIDNIIRLLNGKKHLDIFECARVDPDTPIEETVGAIAEYVKAGKISGIGLCEVSESSIRRAHAIHPIAAVEAEFSLWSTEILENNVAAVCHELKIPIVAYSPLGRGFLTGQIKSIDDIPENDFRRTMDRFQPENFDKNLVLVQKITDIAKKIGVTPTQLALAWVKYHSNRDNLPVIIPIPGATASNRVIENAESILLEQSNIDEIDEVLKSIIIIGGRYNKHAEHLLYV
ncbi:Aldo/keto reductase [Nadsonia fulvescens var. elongata DSM 6958]|uniref:Aldo/keto reductase n=1 Tax=Nadsonia fulvescens var. elongata DSM 6958 TaxID=857566 RepID=A0A1E3PMB9_9ASCO|nr:Aldo/keto reductase [Nadsonia fulvescens var. elongata DSM 6958]